MPLPGRRSTRPSTPYHSGSLRTQGFRNRDLVTALGRKTISGDIRPDRLHAGDRDSLVRELRLDAKALRIVGIVIMAFAALALGLVLWLWPR